MKILKNTVRFLLFTFLSVFLYGCNNTLEPEFRVFGEKQILNKMTISVQSISYQYNPSTPSYTGSII